MDSIDVSFDPSILFILLVLFGFAGFYQAFKTVQQYSAIRRAAATLERERTTADATVVSGPVSVRGAATPDREPPEAVANGAHRPALLAWRIRRQYSSPGRRGSSKTKTAAGGLAVGEFDVRHGGRYARVDGDGLSPDRDDSSDPYDPFDDPALDLGGPEIDVRLGEPDPVTRLLERLRLIGDRGLFGDPELSLSVGGNSVTPDRYQAVVVENGDEIAIEGALRESRDGAVLEPDPEQSPAVVVGDLEERGAALRSLALRHVVYGIILIALGLWLPSLV